MTDRKFEESPRSADDRFFTQRVSARSGAGSGDEGSTGRGGGGGDRGFVSFVCWVRWL